MVRFDDTIIASEKGFFNRKMLFDRKNAAFLKKTVRKGAKGEKLSLFLCKLYIGRVNIYRARLEKLARV